MASASGSDLMFVGDTHEADLGRFPPLNGLPEDGIIRQETEMGMVYII
jgi:hypothetical protein